LYYRFKGFRLAHVVVLITIQQQLSMHTIIDVH